MKAYNDDLTISMVSFFSDEIIKKALKEIPEEYKILVTDNALSNTLKKNLETSFKNVEVITPKSNLGNGGGVNFALDKIDTKYAIYLDVDTKIEKNTLKGMIELAKSRDDWGIIAPSLKNYEYKEINYIEKNLSDDFSNMNFVEGCALLFNLEKLKNVGFYDDKIFLYFEENDLFFRCLKDQKKILLCKQIFIEHIGNSSISSDYSFEIELNRNWHYMWSKFYYYKKNYSFFRGIKETLNQYLRSIIKTIFYYFINKNKFLIYRSRVSGLYNSYRNKTSWMRPNITTKK
jgi:GT2 family glycosyltransferase